jgi:exonuclease SbcD
MKFAHLADVHIGCWQDPKLRDLSIESFESAIYDIIKEEVDYLKRTVAALNKLKDAKIPVYYIAGSHDFSPSGKTMLDVLEEADLCKSVFRGKVVDNKLNLKFTIDEKTGAKIVGVIGKKGMLERQYYEAIGNREELASEPGFKIFMFHTALEELKPKELEQMRAYPVSFLPKGFDYYAGGHVHIVRHENLEGYPNLIYPGPTFPCNFIEMEKLGNGGFYIYDNGKIIRKKIKLKETKNILLKVSSVEELESKAIEELKDVENKIVLLRIIGKLKTGRISDINWKKIMQNNSYVLLRNTIKLTSEEFEEIKLKEGSGEMIEEQVFKEHAGQINNDFSDEVETAKLLLNTLSAEQDEGEKKYEYEERIVKEGKDVVL